MQELVFLGALGTLIMGIKSWAETADKIAAEHDIRVKAAARKVLSALDATESYLSSRRIDKDKENKLQLLWYEASVELQEVDYKLASLCFLKGDYWKNPNEWTESEKGQADISIKNVRGLLKKLLGVDR